MNHDVRAESNFVRLIISNISKWVQHTCTQKSQVETLNISCHNRQLYGWKITLWSTFEDKSFKLLTFCHCRFSESWKILQLQPDTSSLTAFTSCFTQMLSNPIKFQVIPVLQVLLQNLLSFNFHALFYADVFKICPRKSLRIQGGKGGIDFEISLLAKRATHQWICPESWVRRYSFHPQQW